MRPRKSDSRRTGCWRGTDSNLRFRAALAPPTAQPGVTLPDPGGEWRLIGPPPDNSYNEELFRVLEGFPDLAHDVEVDACSGALEMLNPRMSSWGFYELTRRQAQELQQNAQPEPAKSNWAPGSVEW